MSGTRLGAALAAAALASLAPITALAQEPVEIVPGKTVTGKAGTANTSDLYYFVGETGATVTFELKAPGLVSIALLTSDGDTMLEASGTDSAQLEAVLSLTEVFYVAVLRSEPEASYTLAMTTTEPDFHLALFSRNVGYGYDMATVSGTTVLWRKCWVEPGVIYKDYKGPTAAHHEILRGGRERMFVTDPSFPSETKVSWDGQTIKRVSTVDGKSTTYEYPFDDATFARPSHQSLRYTGYLCE